MAQALKKTAGYAGIYAVGALINRGVSFIMLPIYTRVLTLEDYGILELLVLTVDIVSIFTGMGLLSGLHKFFYRYDEEKDRREVVSTLFLMILCFYGVSCLLGAIFAGPISELPVIFGEAGKAHLMRMMFVNLFLSFLVFLPLGYLQVRQRPILFVAMSCTKLALQLSLNIWFVVYLRMGVIGVLYSSTIALSIVGVSLTIYTFSQVGFRFAREKAGELLRFGAPFVLTGFAAFITTYSDRFFLKHYQDLDAVGLYALGYKFGFLLMFFPVSPLFRIWNVQRFELVKESDYVATFNRFLLWFCVVVCTVALGISLSARDLLRVMADYEFREAWVVVPILLFAYFIQACTDYFNFGIYHAGKSFHMAVGTGMAAIVILALSFWWIPRYGAMGAAWATLVAFSVRLAYVYVSSQRSFNVAYRLARPFSVVVLAVALYLTWLAIVPGGSRFEALHLSVPVSVVLFLAFPAILIGGRLLPPEDRGLMIELLRAPRQTVGRIRSGKG
jgi:O-antigen/teichoic acid export membrane protein